MAEKAKAKKAKPLAKKTAAVRPKKKEISVKDAYHEADVEELQLAQEELPKRSSKAGKAAAEKKAQHAPEKAETKTASEEKPAKASHAAPQIITPRVVIEKPAHEAKAEKPKHEAPRHEAKHSSSQHHAGAQNDGLRIRLSESLVKKLKDQAADEGISLEEFISELLAESVVLRAWEIVERKSAMKGGHSQGTGGMGGGNRNYNQNQGNKGNNNNQRGGNQGGGNKGHRMNHARYQSIMDDKATFLEYVRNQEKNRR